MPNKDTEKCDIIEYRATKAQVAFLALCAEIKYGIIKEVVVQAGQPVYATTVEKNFKFAP